MERIADLLKRYRYGALVLLIGLGLMLLPTSQKQSASVAAAGEPEVLPVAEELEQILGQIQGVGKVKVLLTQAAGEITVYQENTDQSGDSLREDTVLITDASRTEQGLVKQVLPPRYQGAVIVCQGGDRASVRLDIVDAVSAVTGLTSDKITVLKMK